MNTVDSVRSAGLRTHEQSIVSVSISLPTAPARPSWRNSPEFCEASGVHKRPPTSLFHPISRPQHRRCRPWPRPRSWRRSRTRRARPAATRARSAGCSHAAGWPPASGSPPGAAWHTACAARIVRTSLWRHLCCAWRAHDVTPGKLQQEGADTDSKRLGRCCAAGIQ